MADLSIRDLVIEYKTGDGGVVRPIYGLNMQVPAGSLVAVVGPSGCGKTSLMSCIGGILRATSGEIRFGSTEVTALNSRGLTDYRRRSVGIVFQSFNLVASLTALENVMVPLWADGKQHWVAQQRARELLTEVGLHDRMEHRPGRLSGGQQQRVAVARAVALEPPLILADEPTAQLDQNRAHDVMALLQSLAGGDRVVVVSTHDTRFLPLADLVIDLGLHTPPVAATPKTVRLSRGSVLLDRGGVEDLVYIVTEGEVEVTEGTDGWVPDADRGLLRIVEPNHYGGPIGPVFRITPPAKVHAQTSSTLMSFTVPQFHRQFGPLSNGV